MNRLVIVGNGFDLAHGLKTSYEDFLVDYFNEILVANKSHEDVLIKMTVSPHFQSIPIDKIKNPDEILNNGLIRLNDGSGVFPNGVQYLIDYKSKFFRHLLINKNWTDIESRYIKYLLSEYRKTQGNYSISDIIQLNKEFDYLKIKLGEYLAKVESTMILPNGRNEILNVLDRTFDKVRSASHRSKLGLKTLSDKYAERVFFVNFNYTSLLEKYLQLLSSDNRDLMTHLPIHGSINDFDSIIFGYGDETHEDYKFLENQDEEELLKNIKSFYYPAKPYYQELMDFIKVGIFDVYVIGHSLGLSDRVLLKTIFEDDNCKAIKLFHRGSEKNQFKKRIALSRHFDDKIAMRNKILNFDAKDVFGGWDSIKY